LLHSAYQILIVNVYVIAFQLVSCRIPELHDFLCRTLENGNFSMIGTILKM
jgi:hypothetical protein